MPKDKYDILRLGELIDAVPENWYWLLRSAEDKGYFCHIHEPGLAPILGLGMCRADGIGFETQARRAICTAHAISAEEAMRQVLRLVETNVI